MISKVRKPAYLIPYLKDNLSSYPLHFGPGSVPSQIGAWERRAANWKDRYEWKKNDSFTASVKFFSMERQGRVLVKDNASGATYSMTIGNLFKLLKKGSIVFGDAFGKWRFQKNGDSYSLVPVF